MPECRELDSLPVLSDATEEELVLKSDDSEFLFRSLVGDRCLLGDDKDLDGEKVVLQGDLEGDNIAALEADLDGDLQGDLEGDNIAVLEADLEADLDGDLARDFFGDLDLYFVGDLGAGWQ